MNSREQLFHVLAEAAELEHNLLCSYLFAAFSLKDSVSEDLTVEELKSVNEWRATLMSVCVEEMVHLTQVSNLLVAVGARPHFNRPNLPVPPGYHPAAVVVELAPFDLATMEHFIYLERPEEAKVAEAEAYKTTQERPPRVVTASLMPSAPDYGTVGEFYGELRLCLDRLVDQLGETAVFCGDSRYQLRGTELGATDLLVVEDLESAHLAIAFIVEQGEGAPGDRESSHFRRFVQIRDECVRLNARRAGFQGHRMVARNPVLRPPIESNRVHVTATRASAVLDVANATYGLLLRCLTEVYELPFQEGKAREHLLGAGIACMKALTALGRQLTRLPAYDGDDAPRAGISFAMLRSTEGVAKGHDARKHVTERLSEVTNGMRSLGIAALDDAAEALQGAVDTMRIHLQVG